MKHLPDHHQVETLSISVRGRVQGVGFRAATVRRAHMHGVTGWVRNMEDGSVQVLAQGEPDRVDSLLSWLHQGPPAARVDAVVHERVDTERHYDRFEQH
ncbi:MAG: acylphosphatase [Candidimonas sp.]|jgi:acylphosphatase